MTQLTVDNTELASATSVEPVLVSTRKSKAKNKKSKLKNRKEKNNRRDKNNRKNKKSTRRINADKQRQLAKSKLPRRGNQMRRQQMREGFLSMSPKDRKRMKSWKMDVLKNNQK